MCFLTQQTCFSRADSVRCCLRFLCCRLLYSSLFQPFKSLTGRENNLKQDPWTVLFWGLFLGFFWRWYQFGILSWDFFWRPLSHLRSYLAPMINCRDRHRHQMAIWYSCLHRCLSFIVAPQRGAPEARGLLPLHQFKAVKASERLEERLGVQQTPW